MDCLRRKQLTLSIKMTNLQVQMLQQKVSGILILRNYVIHSSVKVSANVTCDNKGYTSRVFEFLPETSLCFSIKICLLKWHALKWMFVHVI